jgi:aldehyde dehydrogenase (NAD+)
MQACATTPAPNGPTPVTLELGGKSPVLVDRRVDPVRAARKIVWGKFFNAGQTCLAPDYVLVEEPLADRFAAACVDAVTSFYGRNPEASADYARIVNDRHLARLTALLADHGGSAVCGGESDAATRYLAPTVLVGVDPTSPVMTEEIFGPILPIIAVSSLDEALAFVAARPVPLTVSVFTDDAATEAWLLRETRSGSVAVNTTLEHFTLPTLPFGGLGASGFGTYHGDAGFFTFSHQRATIRRPSRPEIAVAYPPITATKRWLLRKLL